MKKVLIVLGLLGLAALVLALSNPPTIIRYKFTLEIDTPTGVRAASSVINVQVTSSSNSSWTLPDARRATLTVRGEATFVDLGEGKNIIAILDKMHNVEALDPKRPSPVVLLPSELPTLVTFTDITNPASAKVVYKAPDNFAQAFGPGYAFKRAMVEIVPAGIWPFSSYDRAWPQVLFGTPVTRGIEQRFPWWNGPFPWLKPVSIGSSTYVDTRPASQFRVNKDQLKRDF